MSDVPPSPKEPSTDAVTSPESAGHPSPREASRDAAHTPLVRPPLDGPPFEGDPNWRALRELNDGTHVTIRPLTREDREELRQAFRQISPQTRYLRFLGGLGELSEEMLSYLTDVDQKKHVALVAVVTSPDLKAERGVGVARFVFLDGAPGVAEAAITVVDDMQRRGLGTILLRELERAARANGVRRIRAEVLADNWTMRNLLEAAGAAPVPRESVPPSSVPSGAGSRMRLADGTVFYDIELSADPPTSSMPSTGLLAILRGAAETMSLTLRRLFPQTTFLGTAFGTQGGRSGSAPTATTRDDDGADSEREGDPSA